jgi:ribonuclease D
LHALRNFNADGFVDLQVEASRWGIEEKSLRKLSAIVLNKRVSKAQRLSNWEAESLTPQQQEYAATDAWICPEILKELQRVEPKAEPYTIISVMPTPSTSQPQQRHKARHHRRHAHHHSSNKQHIE